jgi:two-component sensor histidine kinase
MNHRIGNLFALASAVTTLSTRFAATPKDLADAVQERLMALSRAHSLTLDNSDEEAKSDRAATSGGDFAETGRNDPMPFKTVLPSS